MSVPASRPAFPSTAFWGGLAVCGLLLVLFNATELDRTLAAHFLRRGWPGESWLWSRLLYRYGEAPAVLVGVFGLGAFSLSFFSPKWRAWRGPGLFLFLLLALGSGLLVNGLGKALLGRPRPFETLGFGGLWDYVGPLRFGVPGKGLSFLSGHAANAWYFLGLSFVLPRGRRTLPLLLAVLFGAAMSLARVAQGAHWLSDTLLAGAVMFTLAAGLSPLIHWQPSGAFFRRPRILAALSGATLAWLSLGHVRYEQRFYCIKAGSEHAGAPQLRRLRWDGGEPSDVAVDLRAQAGDLHVFFQAAFEDGFGPLIYDQRFQGQGLPGARESMLAAPIQTGSGPFSVGPRTLAYAFFQSLSGPWLQVGGDSRLSLPLDRPVDVRLRLDRGTLTIIGLPMGRRVLITRLPAGNPPPTDFAPYGGSAWLRSGAEPLITLDLLARRVRFESPALLPGS